MRLLNTAAWRDASMALAVLLTIGVRGATAQQTRAGEPKFLIASADRRAPARTEPSRIPFLGTRVKLAVKDVPLTQVLAAIGRQTEVRFVYGPDIIPSGRLVSVRADNLTLAAVLTEVLFGTGVDVLISGRQQLTLVPGLGAVKVPTGSIFGRVTDAATGRGIGAVDILLEGTRWHTSTDTTGQFSLTAVDSGHYRLVARRFGYAKHTQMFAVRDGQTDTVDVALTPVVPKLDEVISTATGQRRRLDVANDITTINADSVMQAAPVHSVTDLLENRVPGLTVQRTSGAPGDPARLRLRGASSPLQNNDPVVIVDGVRMYAKQSDARSANLASSGAFPFATPSPLDYIDPNSIETIEVVKGPSASALYGQDAANGVIVITTKKGKAGPTRWALSATHGRTQMAEHYPNLFFRWGHYVADQTPTLCPINGFSNGNSLAGVPCDGDSVRTFQMLNDPQLTVLGTGRVTNLSLGASGGTQTLTYNITGSYGDQLGLVKLPDYEATRYQTIEGLSAPDWMRRPQGLKQWSATTSVDARLGATADVSLAASLSRTRQQRSTLETQLSDLMSTFLDRNSGLYYKDGQPNPSYDVASYRMRVTDAATQFTNRLNANWRPHHWLTLNAAAGLDFQQRADEAFLPRSRDSLLLDGTTKTGNLAIGTGTALTSTVNAGAVAVAPLGLGFLLRFASGINYLGTSINDTKAQSTCLPYGSSDITSCPGFGLSASRNVVNDATFGWYLEPSIGNSKFNVQGGLRLNGGSSYGSGLTGFKLPAFPRLGFSYLLSDEPFFPFKGLFQSFRVRVAYGRAGRQPGPTDRLRLYGTIQRALDGDSSVSDVVALQTLGNTQLRPERSAEFEGGFDADLLDSRLTVSLSGIRKTTNDALLATPVPPSVNGGGTILRNIGVTRNTGLELSVDAQLIRSNAVTWSTRFAMTKNRSMVVRLGPGVQPFYTDATVTAKAGTRVAAGYPLFGRWSRPVLGYADANGNGLLDASEVLLGDTAVYVGRQEPDYQATVQPSVTLWHGALTVTAGITHVGGVAQRNEVAQRLALFSHGASDPTASLAEQLADGIALGEAVSIQGGAPSDFNWIQTVTTTRFDYLSVGYTVPANVARRLGADRLSISVQGSNLGLWTNYRGLDPNVNAFATGNSVTDTGILPMPRTWQVRFDATY